MMRISIPSVSTEMQGVLCALLLFAAASTIAIAQETAGGNADRGASSDSQSWTMHSSASKILRTTFRSASNTNARVTTS
ncbi:MAG: hypothetical protein C0600_03165 [Ignavibacteria bacterium]|nr:MAG: hypothetical protein C0600_03165 [Ignavibacteria bacterium]